MNNKVKVGGISYDKDTIKSYGRKHDKVLVFLKGKGWPWVHRFPNTSKAIEQYNNLKSEMENN